MELDLEGRNADAFIGFDSGSAYEESSRDEESEDHSQNEKSQPLSSAGQPKTKRLNSKRRSRKNSGNGFNNEATSELDEVVLQKLRQEYDVDEKIREDAKKWAANFEAPQSPGQIRSPPRQEAGSRKRKQGDQPPHVPSKIRAKRFKSFYSNEYRELLNSEIQDASTLGSTEGQSALSNSQIGSSIWTSKEKDVFFSALARLGRDNIAGIAHHIGTKSELEVQEYAHVLHEALRQRLDEDNRKQTLHVMDYPAAHEISEECCEILERAADALSTRQDCYEIEKEEARWYGDSWLLTQKLSKTIHKQRRDPMEEAEIEATLPAANLFDLRNWLELSREIFMNRGAPDGDENWQNFAEPGELPAIRTTAFEDFYSLAVSVTKRLISTTLFCTMSRQKARQSKLLKHADVTQDDVEAAIKMLGLPSNSGEFWTTCARRCHLEVINDEEPDNSDGALMTYEEVELAIAGDSVSHACSHPIEQQQMLTSASKVQADSEDLTHSPSEIEYSISDESGHSVDYNQSDMEERNLSSFARKKSRKRKREKEKEMLRAQEEYTEAFDMRESQCEETRLWSMLHQIAPFDLQVKELPDRPRVTKNDADRVSSWRENTEYWSTWEMMSTPVPNQNFIQNKEVKSKRRVKKERIATNSENVEQPSDAGDIEEVGDVISVAGESDIEPSTDGEGVQVSDELHPAGQDHEDKDDNGEEQIHLEYRSPSPSPRGTESP